MNRTDKEDLAMRMSIHAQMTKNLRAMDNRNFVRRRLWVNQPMFALCLDRTVTELNTVGFGDLDFEHGEPGPRLGSDEVK